MEITSLGNKKSPRSLHLGNKDRMNILRYHLVCRRSDHLMQMPTHPLPHNAGNTSEDTRKAPFPLPSTAHLPTRFSLRSQLCGTLCGCADDFTSVSTVSYLRYAYYNVFVSICQVLFFTLDGQFKKPPRPLDLGGWGNYLFSISFRASLRLKLARPFSSKPMNFT